MEWRCGREIGNFTLRPVSVGTSQSDVREKPKLRTGGEVVRKLEWISELLVLALAQLD